MSEIDDFKFVIKCKQKCEAARRTQHFQRQEAVERSMQKYNVYTVCMQCCYLRSGYSSGCQCVHLYVAAARDTHTPKDNLSQLF